MKNIVKRYIKITVFIVSLLIIINSIFIKQWTNKMERKILRLGGSSTLAGPDDLCAGLICTFNLPFVCTPDY